ncbi:DNA-binding transcriptional regulator, MarR family [Neorhodopirellula lusitana]|uniref:DNA-binding transcriptional regulator, MarR family n=1 Tax=Neorhodopirellula lusitana TaxID=445327 RepID=A0ABY1PR23_9BACT|nr:DNA-binding transcriptional regulator, MarR family [Neorhodopirellula lusitana]
MFRVAIDNIRVETKVTNPKIGGKPALMVTSCDAIEVSDQERIACGLHIASRGLSSAMADAVTPHGLSGMEANLLLKLDKGLNSPSEIATYLGIDASNLSRLMRKMQEAELIRREVDPTNRSRVIIELTAQGKRLVKKIKPDVREMEKNVMSVLTAKELTTLQKILMKMCVSVLEG